MSKLMKILSETRPDNDFENSTNFLADGLLDSLDIVSVLTEIEEICNTEIDYAEITEDDFVSEETILGLVASSGGNIDLLK